MAGRHRPTPMSGPKRGSIAASIVAVLIGGTLGIVHVVDASASGCSQNSITLNVAAAPDIAPALTTAADQWQRTDPTVDRQCIRVVVTAEPPAQTANLLVAGSGMTVSDGVLPNPSSSDAVSPPAPAVWVPDSSVWLNRVQGDVSEAFVAGTPPSLASSPVVLGIQHSDAAKLKLTDGTITPQALKAALGPMRVDDNTPGVKHPTPFQLGLAEPRNDAAGLAGAAALYQIDTHVEGNEQDYSLVVSDFRLANPEAEMATDSAGLIAAFTTKNTSFKAHTHRADVDRVPERAVDPRVRRDASRPRRSTRSGWIRTWPVSTIRSRSSRRCRSNVGDAAAKFQNDDHEAGVQRDLRDGRLPYGVRRSGLRFPGRSRRPEHDGAGQPVATGRHAERSGRRRPGAVGCGEHEVPGAGHARTKARRWRCRRSFRT